MSIQPPYNQYVPQPPTYRSAHGRAHVAMVLLGINALLHFFSLLVALLILFFPAADRVDEVSNDPMVLMVTLLKAGLALLLFLVYIVTIVFFLMWMYRSYENLPAFHPRTSIKFSSGWAVGSFFVPFVSLVVPYQAMKELWRKSEPPGAIQFGDLAPPSFFPLWWAFWIASNVGGQIYFRIMVEEKVPSDVTNLVGLASDLVAIPAALLAILVVRSIDRRQTEASAALNVQFSQPPPPPPPFSPVST